MSRAGSVCLTQEEERERVKHEGKLSEKDRESCGCTGVMTLGWRESKESCRVPTVNGKGEKPEVSLGSGRSH